MRNGGLPSDIWSIVEFVIFVCTVYHLLWLLWYVLAFVYVCSAKFSGHFSCVIYFSTNLTVPSVKWAFYCLRQQISKLGCKHPNQVLYFFLMMLFTSESSSVWWWCGGVVTIIFQPHLCLMLQFFGKIFSFQV